MAAQPGRYALMLYAADPAEDRYGPVFAVDDEAMLERLAGDLKQIVETFPEGELRRTHDGELLWRKGPLDA